MARTAKVQRLTALAVKRYADDPSVTTPLHDGGGLYLRKRDVSAHSGTCASPSPPQVPSSGTGCSPTIRWAGIGPVRVNLHAVLDGCLVPAQTLSCRALVLVITRDVDEVGLAEAPLTAAIDTPGRMHSSMTAALNSALCRRPRRRPIKSIP